MTAHREHRVSLSAGALEIVESIQGLSTCVFAGASKARPLSQTLTAALKRMDRGDPNAHGFRSTLRDWCAAQTAYRSEVAETAPAHTVSDKAEAVYRRGDRFEKRRRLMDDRAAWCAQPRTSGEVIAIRRAV